MRFILSATVFIKKQSIRQFKDTLNEKYLLAPKNQIVKISFILALKKFTKVIYKYD